MSAPPTRRPLHQRFLSPEFLGLLCAAALAGCGGGEDRDAATADAAPMAAATASVSVEDAMPDPEGAHAIAVGDTGPALEAVAVNGTVSPESAATLAAAPPAVEDTEPAVTVDTGKEVA